MYLSLWSTLLCHSRQEARETIRISKRESLFPDTRLYLIHLTQRKEDTKRQEEGEKFFFKGDECEYSEYYAREERETTKRFAWRTRERERSVRRESMLVSPVFIHSTGRMKGNEFTGISIVFCQSTENNLPLSFVWRERGIFFVA